MDSSKSPFDDPKFSGPDESRGDSPASATGIFGKVNTTPAQQPQEDDWLKSLLRTETPSGNTEPAAVTPLPPVASVGTPAAASSSNTPGSFTQMFQALKAADTTPAKIESVPPVPVNPAPVNNAPAKPSADLTSVFTPISVGKPAAAPVPAAAPEPKPGEFTQLLRTLNTPVLRGESEPASQPVVEEPKISSPQASKEPGSFTQLFNAASLQSPPQEQAFTPAPTPESAPPATPASTAGPGAFTQMFQTLSPEHAAKDNPVAAPAVQTAAPFTPQATAPLIQEQAPGTPQPAPQQPAAVGGFTQMFQSLSPKAEPAPLQPSAPPAAFEPPPPVQPKSGPGSFTQMFSQIGGQSAGQADPLASLKQEPAPPASFQFSTPAPNANPFGSASPRPDQRPSSGPPTQGGFTQLFQALGTENTPQAKEPPPLMPSPPAVNPAPPAAGGFTQLLRTLNTQPPQQAAPLPMAAASAPPAPMPQSGPGEFTRIISGSILREAQGQNVAPGPPVMPPAPAPGGGQPAFQMPPAPAFPKIPQAPPMHAGGGAAPQMPHFQPPPFAFPPAPVPATPPPPSKLQQYLPLILVVNVFVLIVVILIVVFALRHH